jgi:hypothetical protein
MILREIGYNLRCFVELSGILSYAEKIVVRLKRNITALSLCVVNSR